MSQNVQKHAQRIYAKELTMNDPIRLGFVGAGTHARLMLYPSLHFASDVRLTAIATKTQASADRAKQDFRVRCHVGLEAMLADDQIDAVLVCVKGPEAAAVCEKVIRAGKHVLCETPAVTSAADVELIRKALAAGPAASPVVYQVGYCLRYAAIYRKFHTLFADWRKQEGGAFCLDIRYYEWIHHFYNLALYLCGDVTSVKAWGKGQSKRIVLEFENGDLGTIRSTCFRNHGIPYEEVEVTRDDGMLRAMNRSDLQLFREPENLSPYGMTFDAASATTWRQPTSLSYNQLNSFYANGYAAQIVEFAQCIRQGATPVSSLDDAARTMTLGQQINEAISAS